MSRLPIDEAVPSAPSYHLITPPTALKALLLLLALTVAIPACARDSVVVFNEVHYQPAGDDSTLEYVELYNQLAVDVDLSNWRLDGDIRFDFPEGTVLGGGEYLVIARDPAALQAATGFGGALGPYDGFLSNSGTPIRLYNNNRSFRTTPQSTPGLPADKLWSIDLQGDGNGGAFGQLSPPNSMSGLEVNSGLGNVWNTINISGHDGTTTNPSMNLVDSAGAASSVSFSITGTVTGWSQAGSALVSDYLFVNAGNSDPDITWQIAGLTPGVAYSIHAYGGISRDIKLTIDKDADGDLADETPILAAGAGSLVEDITASPSGVIIGRARNGSVNEGNWGGFQVFEQQAAAGPPVGTATDSLAARRIMDELDHSDTHPWPVGPDGSGFTLAKRDPATGTAQPGNWSTSGALNGTPGGPNAFPPLPRIAINEVTATTDPEFQVELYNHGDTPVSLGGMIIGASDPVYADHVLPARTLLPGEFTTIDAAALGFTPVDNNRLFLFTAGRTLMVDAVRVDNRALARHPDGTGPWLRPDAPTIGSANSVSLESAIVINEILYHAYPRRASQDSSSGTTDLQVMDFDHVWRFNLDAGPAGLPANWAATAHTVDGVSWDQGPGLLGLEDDPLGEPIRTTVILSAKIPYYFETEFTHTDPEGVDEMVIEHYLDDGAVFYLNGVELGRFNMPPGPVSPSTLASPGVTNAALRTLTIPAPNVLPGSNRLSVEVHQSSTGSSDLVLGARVTLRTGNPGDSYAERDEEWLELHNRGDVPVDLTGWTLDGGVGYRFPDGTMIPPGGYLVIAKDAAALAAKHPGATILGDYSGRLDNGGDLIVVEDPGGNAVDEVRYYDSGRWHKAADGGGSSLELRDPDSDNKVAGAWSPSDESSRSPWQTYTYEGVAVSDGIGNNVYHEFLLGLLDAGEFLLDDVSVIENGGIEFIQNGDFEADSPGGDAAKWRVIGTHGSHGRTMVVADPDNPGNQCLHVVATGPTEDKHNKIETTFANSQTVVPGRSYRISFRAKWLSGANLVNTRLYFNYLQRTTKLEVPEVWGTPGLPNTAAVANAGPTLTGLSHSPVVPNAGQDITVTVEAADPDGISGLSLYYSVAGGRFTRSTMSAGAGGTYTGTIPGQGGNQIIRFYVRAEDTPGASSLFPAAGAEGGAYIKTQDNYADNSGIRHNFRIIMSDSDRSFLFLNTNRMSNDRFPVTVIEDEQTVYYDVGLRLKASAFGRYNSAHYGFNVRFHPDQLFRGVHESISVERSPNLKELFAKHLMNRAGGGYWSFYDDVAHVITPSPGDRGPGLLSMSRHTSTFFDGLFPGTDEPGTLFNHELLYNPNGTTGGPEGLKIGNPYNHTNGRYDLEDRGLDKEPYRWGFQIRSARGRDDYSRLVALNQAMELSGTALKNALDPIIDADQWMRTFAMMSLNGTDDVYGRIWEHNFRFYVRPTDQKIMIFQWDLDRSFQLSSGASVTSDRNSVVKLFSIPQYRRLFDGHLDDLIHTTFNSTYAAPWASHFTAITGDGMTGLPGYISNRASFVQGTLPAPVPFRITTHGGSDFSEADSVVALAGNGWVDVFRIEVNGTPAPITWTGSDSWQITVPIAIGSNPLALTAYNHRGTPVGTDRITVTNTSAVDVASAGNIIVSELHYHPATPTAAEVGAGFTDQDWFEFVELTNVGPVQVDLSRCQFTEGVVFTFPIGTMLAPGASLIVVSRRDAFEFRYGAGTAMIAGEYAGQFRNSGEEVVLVAADSTPIAEFTYGQELPWPDGADGPGYSLVFSGGDPASALNWRMSTSLDGNPGTSDRIPFAGGPGELLPYALHRGPSGGIMNDRFVVSVDVNLAADDAVVTVEFSTDLVSWTPAAETDLLAIVHLGGGAAAMSWRSPFPVSGSPGQFARVGVQLR